MAGMRAQQFIIEEEARREMEDAQGQAAPVPAGLAQRTLDSQCEDIFAHLLLWRIAQDGGISDELVRKLGIPREVMEGMIAEHPKDYQEYLSLHRLNLLFDLQDLFELARARLTQMLNSCSKPTELRNIVGCLRQLPGAKSLLAVCDDAQLHAETLIQLASEEVAGKQAGAERNICQKLKEQLCDPQLSRQQRRQLERQLRKQS